MDRRPIDSARPPEAPTIGSEAQGAGGAALEDSYAKEELDDGPRGGGAWGAPAAPPAPVEVDLGGPPSYSYGGIIGNVRVWANKEDSSDLVRRLIGVAMVYAKGDAAEAIQRLPEFRKLDKVGAKVTDKDIEAFFDALNGGPGGDDLQPQFIPFMNRLRELCLNPEHLLAAFVEGVPKESSDFANAAGQMASAVSLLGQYFDALPDAAGFAGHARDGRPYLDYRDDLREVFGAEVPGSDDEEGPAAAAAAGGIPPGGRGGAGGGMPADEEPERRAAPGFWGGLWDGLKTFVEKQTGLEDSSDDDAGAPGEADGAGGGARGAGAQRIAGPGGEAQEEGVEVMPVSDVMAHLDDYIARERARAARDLGPLRKSVDDMCATIATEGTADASIITVLENIFVAFNVPGREAGQAHNEHVQQFMSIVLELMSRPDDPANVREFQRQIQAFRAEDATNEAIFDYANRYLSMFFFRSGQNYMMRMFGSCRLGVGRFNGRAVAKNLAVLDRFATIFGWDPPGGGPALSGRGFYTPGEVRSWFRECGDMLNRHNAARTMG